MKLLLLGGHGFVGRNLLRALRGSAYEVIPRSRRDGLDLCSFESAKSAIEELQPDAIFNCSAHVGSLHYVTRYAADVLNDNVQMTLNLYRAVTDSCPKARIINPLSNCSYPGEANVHTEREWWSGEVHESVYAYGNAKRVIYVAAWCYLKQYGIRSVNFLVPNTFGPGDSTDPNRTHALNGMIIRMLKARSEGKAEFEVWGTGTPVREWGYIEDVVEILKRGLTIESDLAYPVNIAQRRGHSIRESAEAIRKAVNFKGRIVFNENYPDGAPRKVLDDERFRALFPDFRFTDHEEAIRRTVEYYESVL